MPCNCNTTGSLVLQCDQFSGQCSCKPGITGSKCDRCSIGYFSFMEKGCTACECNREGSLSLQCDESGQCSCRLGVSGRRCDMCAENFAGNGTHCFRKLCRSFLSCLLLNNFFALVACGVCYSDVQAGVEELRQRVKAIRTQLTVFEKSRHNETFQVHFEDAERRVRQLQNDLTSSTARMDNLWVDIRLAENRIVALQMQVSSASSLSRDGQRIAVTASTQSQQVEELLSNVEADVTDAHVTLSRNIEPKSRSITGDFSNITALASRSADLAQEASDLVDLHNSNSDIVINTAARVGAVASEAKLKAEQAWMDQQNDKRRITDIAISLSNLNEEVEDTKAQVILAETEALQVEQTAAQVLANASLPPSNHTLMDLRHRLSHTDNTTKSLAAQTESLQSIYSSTVTEVEQKRSETTKAFNQATSLGLDAESLKQHANNAYGKASNAVSSGTATLNAAKDMLDVLQNFNERITETSAQAATALEKVDEIRIVSEAASKQARQVLSDNQQALVDAQTAEKLAEEAKSTAETAEQTATDVRSNFNQIIITASTQRSEAADEVRKASMLNASAESALQSCAADKATVEKFADNVDTAVSDLTACDQRIDEGQAKVKQLLEDIINLDQLDSDQINVLTTRIQGLKQRLQNLDLTAVLASLSAQLKRQQVLAADHESVITSLRQEVDDVKVIFQNTCT